MALWIDDPLNVLFDVHKFHQIIPDASDSMNEQVNAFTRFILMYGTILSVYKKSWDPLVFAILMSVAVLVFVFFIKKNRVEKFIQANEIKSGQLAKNTLENPYGNPPVGSKLDSNIQADTRASDQLYEYGIPMDEWDIYGKNNSQRQFFTIPHNDQTSFAKWLYDPGNVCKTSPMKCTGY